MLPEVTEQQRHPGADGTQALRLTPITQDPDDDSPPLPNTLSSGIFFFPGGSPQGRLVPAAVRTDRRFVIPT
jgi:hypothetical protein